MHSIVQEHEVLIEDFPRALEIRIKIRSNEYIWHIWTRVRIIVCHAVCDYIIISTLIYNSNFKLKYNLLSKLYYNENIFIELSDNNEIWNDLFRKRKKKSEDNIHNSNSLYS